MVLSAEETARKLEQMRATFRGFDRDAGMSCPLLVILDFDRTLTTAERFVSSVQFVDVLLLQSLMLRQRNLPRCVGDGCRVQTPAGGGERTEQLPRLAQ
jgi:hypothetical protein